MTRTAAAKQSKSTRPSTRSGRAVRNALSHGLFSTAPVIPGVEFEDQWLAHLAGVIQSLLPVGHLETLLAQRVAFHFWRLRRLIRYETQLVTSADPDARSSSYNGHPLSDPPEPELQEWEQVDRVTYDKAHRILHSIDTVMLAVESKPISASAALDVIEAVHMPASDAPLNQFSVPGSPNTPITAFTAWTAGLVRNTVHAISEHYRRDPEQQMTLALMRYRDLASRVPISEADDDEDQVQNDTGDEVDDDDEAADDTGTIRLYPRRSRGLPTSMPIDSVLERFTRFESHISRELRVALREFDYWQSRRLGRRVAHQVEVAAAPNGKTAENTDSAN